MLENTIRLGNIVPGSRHFKWHEFLLQRGWGRCVFPSNEEYRNIIVLVQKLQFIRDMFNAPIFITSGLRTYEYNRHIGGGLQSQHKNGAAADFIVKGYEGINGCETVRETLKPKLDSLDIRMENFATSNWIHIDIKRIEANEPRYFFP